MLSKLWEALRRPLEFLQDPKGEYSSKRLFGLACFGVAIALAFMPGSNTNNVAIFMAGATAVFIAQAASGT